MQPTFTIAFWCILAAACLPFFGAVYAKKDGFGKSKKEGGYDNNNPREWLAKQTGACARANAAQNNTFEVLPFFFAAVIIAHYLGANQTMVDILAVAWVLTRLLYVVCYIKDWAGMRSLVWFIAFGINIALLLIGM